MIKFCRNVIEAARADHRARRALVWECVVLQHQLAVLRRSGTRRPRFRPIKASALKPAIASHLFTASSPKG